MDEVRHCNLCGVVLTSENTYRHLRCKECYNASERARYKPRERKPKVPQEPKPNDPSKEREYRQRWKTENPEAYMLKSAQQRARDGGYPCTITTADIVIPAVCPVLGIPLEFSWGRKGGTDASPSLDKMVPELGYVPGNVFVISYRANRIKNNATPEELLAVARYAQGA